MFLLGLFSLANAAGPAAGQPSAASPLASFIPFILIFVVFYFLLIMPQQKQRKEMAKMLESLKKGDYVLTSSGIYGTIISIKPEGIELKVDDNVKLLILKSAIAQVIKKTESVDAKIEDAQIIK